MVKKVIIQRVLAVNSDGGSVTFFFHKTLLPGVINDGNYIMFMFIDASIEVVDTPLSGQHARFFS